MPWWKNWDEELYVEGFNNGRVWADSRTARGEHHIGVMLASDSATSVIARHLRANDQPGHTFLLRVEADELLVE